MPSNNLAPEEVVALNQKAEFEKNKDKLYAYCMKCQAEGVMLSELAFRLNAEGKRTKTGLSWEYGSLYNFIRGYQTRMKSNIELQPIKNRQRQKNRKGQNKTNDKDLRWVENQYPHLEEWRKLGSEWLRSRENGLGPAIQGVNHFITFLAETGAPASPLLVMQFRTKLPDFYQTRWASKRTKGHIQANNQAHYFLEWVLMRPEYCAEDDGGKFVTLPVFSNPVKLLTVSGIPVASESVRPCLPYGYIDELRKMIAEGKDFSDWKWAQTVLGNSAKPGRAHKVGKDGEDDDTDDGRLAQVWYQVEPHMIDKTDPDCVWRMRTRTIQHQKGMPRRHGQKETVYEMWSPVRWVALLIKLQLPLRTFQVRMLDSGEADTYKYENGSWGVNDCELALGSSKRPYSNGVFLRANQLIDGNAEVLLHINTNKSNDSGKYGSAKGYNVPWVVGGPLHQDPFYWLQKLRKWQEKYNPLSRLTKWTELDAVSVKVVVARLMQLFETYLAHLRPGLPPSRVPGST